MTCDCPLFVELCAGVAAVSLRLHKDGAKPPVSRMGSKSGYADRILTLLGLVPGQGAAAYLWCEPDPGVRLLLEAYRDAGLAREAAAIIRSWATEDPRALWGRLRAEGPPRLPEGEVDAGEVARFAQIVASNRLINVAWSSEKGCWANTGKGGTTFGGAEFATPVTHTADGLDASPADLPAVIACDARQIDPHEVARWGVLRVRTMPQHEPGSDGYFLPMTSRRLDVSRYQLDTPAPALDRLPTLSATIAPDARAIDPREVARSVITGQWAYRRGCPESGFAESRTGDGSGEGRGNTADTLASMWATAPVMSGATIHPDARQIDPPALPPGTVVYMDPPYVGTTGYAHDLGRAEVVALARRWAAAGATVAISEAEPIADLVAEGWHAVEITGQRKGQKRTFSKQQREFLTMNREPVEAVGPVFDLFGG